MAIQSLSSSSCDVRPHYSMLTGEFLMLLQTCDRCPWPWACGSQAGREWPASSGSMPAQHDIVQQFFPYLPRYATRRMSKIISEVFSWSTILNLCFLFLSFFHINFLEVSTSEGHPNCIIPEFQTLWNSRINTATHTQKKLTRSTERLRSKENV